MTNSLGIIIIGDEILSGRRKDKHLEKSIELLAKHGLQLCWARYAGDDEDTLAQHFREIRKLGDICFSFGGIGATIDDRTRQAVAKAFDLQMVRHPEAVSEIEAEFGADAYPNRILMADLPEGTTIIPNPYNRIPGFSINNIHCLPGFPVMAWPMLEWLLETKYAQASKADIVYYSYLLTGAKESNLIQLLEQAQRQHPNVKISSLPSSPGSASPQIELGVCGVEPFAQHAYQSLKNMLYENGLIESLL